MNNFRNWLAARSRVGQHFSGRSIGGYACPKSEKTPSHTYAGSIFRGILTFFRNKFKPGLKIIDTVLQRVDFLSCQECLFRKYIGKHYKNIHSNIYSTSFCVKLCTSNWSIWLVQVHSSLSIIQVNGGITKQLLTAILGQQMKCWSLWLTVALGLWPLATVTVPLLGPTDHLLSSNPVKIYVYWFVTIVTFFCRFSVRIAKSSLNITVNGVFIARIFGLYKRV